MREKSCVAIKQRKHYSAKAVLLYFFTLINIKNNEKRKILPLSFLRD